MKIATISLDIILQNIDANLEKAKYFISQAKKDNCDVVVFPEIFDIGFSTSINKYCQIANNKTYKILKKLAIQYSINIIAGIAEKSKTKKVNNTAVVFNNLGEEVVKYYKIHPFSYANEHKYFNSGNKTVIFELDNIKCSIFICYDLRFPEIFRQVAKKVNIIFVIANWPKSRELHWSSLLVARAIENQCFIVGVNRTGCDNVNRLIYNGCSMVVHPQGKILLKTKHSSEYNFCDIDVEDVLKTREEFPFLSDIKASY